MTVPYIFGNTPGGASIPLAELDADFAYVFDTSNSFAMELVTVTALNTFAPLSKTYDGTVFLLIINTQSFTPLGSPQVFSVSGNVITWTSTLYQVSVGDQVVAIYSHT